MTMMAAFLALALTASSLTAGGYISSATSSFAEFLFVVIVVLWGTRAAAQSIVGEIRDKTWDLQRLSAIGPWEMVWGKLFGSTLLMWFGGAICLVPIVAYTSKAFGPWAAAVDLGYYLSLGIMAHAGRRAARIRASSPMCAWTRSRGGVSRSTRAASICGRSPPSRRGSSPGITG
jgi:hypothetical protein